VAEKTSTKTESPTGSTGTMTQLLLGLLWLGTTMWTAHATIKGGGADASGVLGAAAAALPGLVAATLVTGASIGHAASGRFSGPFGRLLAGLLMGALFGLAVGAGIRLVYGSDAAVMKLAIVVGLASVVGGALAVLPDKVLDAGLWATTWVFFAGIMFGVLQKPLLDLLGGTAATARFVLVQSVVTGLFAALQGYRWLVWGRPNVAWHFVAGALPGVILLAAEYLTRIGGSSLSAIVNGYSADDPALIDATPSTRVRHAIIVLAVGGFVTMMSAVIFRARKDDASAFDEVDASSSSSSSDDD
jgi:uncharacterized membrane protein